MITAASSKYDHDDFFSPHHCRSLSLSHFPSSVSSSFFSAFLFSLSLSLLLPLFSLVLSSWPFGSLSYHRSHPRADTKKSEAYFIPKIKKRQKDEVSSCPPPGAAPTTLLPLCIFIGCEDCGRKNRGFSFFVVKGTIAPPSSYCNFRMRIWNVLKNIGLEET